jgi:hypothetical protein
MAHHTVSASSRQRVVASDDAAERRRLARRLLAAGRGFAEEYGFPVTNNPSNLFQVLCLAVLLRRVRDPRQAIGAAAALREAGWHSSARLAGIPDDRKSALLRGTGLRRPDGLAVALGRLAAAVTTRYAGDLRRIRSVARRDRSGERAALRTLPEVDDQVVDLFLREAQAVWPEAAPCADRQALAAARRLGLGSSADELAELIGGREPERLAWLVGTLARVDLEDRYRDFDHRTR